MIGLGNIGQIDPKNYNDLQTYLTNDGGKTWI